MLTQDGPDEAPEPQGSSAAERLQSWKEIAAYLHRDVTTVQRWEKREGLPVHRHVHEKLGTVYAYRLELDAWLRDRRPRVDARRSRVTRRPRLSWFVAAAAVLAAAAGALWYWGRAPSSTALGVRRVWAGPDVDRLGSVSADGRYCSFTDPGTGDLSVRDLAEGTQRHLTSGLRARWEFAAASIISPDGRQVAYAWFNPDLFYELRLIGMDGSGQRVLYRNPEVFCVQPADWSRDGRHILALLSSRDRINRIALIGVADGSVRVLKTLATRAPLRMNLSPDGRYVVYDFAARGDRADHDVFVIAAVSEGEGNRETTIVEHRSNDVLLGWAPDGKTILFASDRTGTVDAWSVQVAGGKPQGAPQLIRKDLGPAWPLGFTQKGSYYYAVQLGMTDVYVGDFDRATGKLLAPPRPLAHRFVGWNRSPDWSADGRYLAYVSQPLPSERAARSLIAIRSFDTHEERELGVALRRIELLRWAPDGRSIYVTGDDEMARQGLFRVDARTGRAEPVVQNGDLKAYFHELALTPDRRRVFYKLRNWLAEPGRLLLRDLATGEEKEALRSVYRFALSPDGGQLAFSTYVAEHMQAVMLMPASGGQARELHRRRGQIVSIAWTPDARHLLFARRDELWRLSVEGGQVERLAVLKENLRELRVHPDGGRIAYSAGERRSEVWVMENFLPESGR